MAEASRDPPLPWGTYPAALREVSARVMPIGAGFVVQSLLQVVKFLVIVVSVVGVLELYLYVHLRPKRISAPGMAVFAAGACLAAACGYALWVKAAPGGEGYLRPLPLARVLAAALAVEGLVMLLTRRVFRGRNATTLMLVSPAFIGLAVLLLFPFCFEVYLAFTQLNLYTVRAWVNTGRLTFAGLTNFVNVFTTSPLYRSTFWVLLGRTFLWTVLNVSCQVSIGTGLAILLNRPMRLRGVYRTILTLPWAVPSVISILAWRGEFAPDFGFIGIILGRLSRVLPILARLGLNDIPWRSHPVWTFLMCVMVNVWIGVPFNMVTLLGGLQSISPEFYDAAQIDGASGYQQFRHVTLPLLRPVLAPVVALGFIWTFNAINVIYLMTGQRGGVEYADILVSALYKAAFQFNRYSFAAAMALVIFVILLGLTTVWLRTQRATESVY